MKFKVVLTSPGQKKEKESFQSDFQDELFNVYQTASGTPKRKSIFEFKKKPAKRLF